MAWGTSIDNLKRGLAGELIDHAILSKLDLQLYTELILELMLKLGTPCKCSTSGKNRFAILENNIESQSTLVRGNPKKKSMNRSNQ